MDMCIKISRRVHGGHDLHPPHFCLTDKVPPPPRRCTRCISDTAEMECKLKTPKRLAYDLCHPWDDRSRPYAV